MEQTKLDNMTGQEIKEMITRQEINLEDLSIPALNCLFEYESDAVCKGEGDTHLLCRCADILAQKEGTSQEHDEVFAAMLNNAMQSVLPVTQPKTKNHRFKKALLIAAAIAVLVCSASFVVAAFGVDVFGYFRELFSLPTGATMEKDGVTLVHNGVSEKYASFSELLDENELKIMYPVWLPNGVSITSIEIYANSAGKETLEIKTNDIHTSICIDIGAIDIGGTYADCEKLEINGKTFYIRNEICSAFCYYKENYYSIQASNLDNLLFMIKHMED